MTINFTPTADTPSAPTGDFGFKPDGGVAPPTPKSGGGFMQSASDIAGGAMDFINNNPISHGLTSLSAMPVQLLAKSMGQPDPYAGGIGTGPGTVHVTSSDQPLGKYAEEQAGNALTVGSLFFPAGKVAEAGAPFLGPALGRFAPAAARIGTQAALGSVQGAGGAMQGGGSTSDITGGAKMGAAFGGGLASAGELGSALLSSLSKTSGAGRLTEHVEGGGAAKTLTKAFNDASTPTTNPIKTMEEQGLIKNLRVVGGKVVVDHVTNPAGTGALDSLIQDQQEAGSSAIKAMGNAGGPTVNPEDAGIPLEKFKQSVIDYVKANPALKASGNVGKMTAEVNRRFEDYAQSYGETMTFEDIDSVRKAMNKMWNPETWDAEKAVGNSARALLYNAPNGGTALQTAMKNEQELINAKEFLQKLSGTAVRGGRLTKIIADSTAAAVGAGIGLPIPFVGPAIGAGVSAYTTNKVINAMQEGFFNPSAGRAAQSLQSFAPALSATKAVGQGMLIPSLTSPQK